MLRVAVVGGETHSSEVTRLNGHELLLVGAAVRPEQVAEASKRFTLVMTDYKKLIEDTHPDTVSVLGELLG